MAAELGLQDLAMALKFTDHILIAIRSENADEHVRVLQVRGDIDVVNGHKCAFKAELAGNNPAQLAFEQFVDPKQPVFHWKWSNGQLEQWKWNSADQSAITPALQHSYSLEF